MKDISKEVRKLMMLDSGYQPHFNYEIRDIYENATEEEKEKIDTIFLFITGYDLATILRNTK